MREGQDTACPCRPVAGASSKLQQTALDRAAQGSDRGLDGYEIGSKERTELDTQLKQYTRDRVEIRVREASNTVLSRMRDR
eukprot:jgi/Botrbrau1/19934/Bobra.0059s0051.1